MVVNVSVTGAAAEATREEESLWDTHEARKGGRTTFAWSSTTEERTTGETKSMEKFDRTTTSSHADTSNSRETGTQGLTKANAVATATIASLDREEGEERIEMRGNAGTTLATLRENDTGKVKTSNGRYSTVASNSVDETGRKINPSGSETFVQTTARRPSFDKSVVFTRNFDNVSRCHVS